MSNDSTTTEPMPRREVWLRIALAVAQGLPEPADLTTQPGIISLRLDTVAEADAWGEWLGVDSRLGDRINYYSRGALFMGAKWGWQWQLRAYAVVVDETHIALATEVADAITAAGVS